LKPSKSAASTTGGNFDEFKIGRAAWEACSINSELGNHLSICLKTEENQENLCRDGRSQDLPDAYWLLSLCLSPSSKDCLRNCHWPLTKQRLYMTPCRAYILREIFYISVTLKISYELRIVPSISDVFRLALK
jgi:hypothetical protein